MRHVLGHRSGVVGARRLLPKEACYDWETMTTALAEAEPWWEPGTRHGYHVWTYGWIIGEIVRRVSGRRPGEFVREEIVDPLGLDFFIGTPASEHGRIADIVPPSRNPLPEPDVTSMLAMAHNNPPWELQLGVEHRSNLNCSPSRHRRSQPWVAPRSWRRVAS